MENNIYDLINNTLENLNYPVKQQGTFHSDKTLPETFVTYFIVDSSSSSHYDNTEESKKIRVQVTIYSKKPAIHQNGDQLFKSVMIPAGFLRIGGRDLPYNQVTGHYAYACDYRYYESEE